jgi:Flp pilus assembly protein TadD
VPDGEDIMYLTPAFESQLHQRVDPSWPAPRRLAELRIFLFADDELDIRYRSGVTRTAMETYAARSGNCLSLTNLFVATARSLGINAYFQQVDIRPTWGQKGSLTIRYEHVVAAGHLPNGLRYVVDFLPDAMFGEIDRVPSADRDARSMFFSNKGAEQLLKGDQMGAIHYLQQAVRLSPESSSAWTNMGAAQRRAGNLELAEFSYLHALQRSQQNLSALNNLAALYDAQGRVHDAEEITKRVQRYRRRNPYYHFLLANRFFDAGQFLEAEVLLQAAIRLKDDDPSFYRALALTYAQLGDERQERQMRQRANRLGGSDPAALDPGLSHRFRVDRSDSNDGAIARIQNRSQ